MRILLKVAATRGMPVRHMDLISAFLHEQYYGAEPLCLEPLPKFDGTSQHLDKVAKINNNIFGTQDAPSRYYKGVHTHMIACGYTLIRADRNPCVKRDSGDIIIIAITMDDFTVATNHD